MRKLLVGLVLLAGLIPAMSASASQPYAAWCNTGESCGGISENGSRAVFPYVINPSDGPLVDDYTDFFPTFQRYQGLTSPLMSGTGQTGDYFRLLDISDDARKVFVQSNLKLSPDDADGSGAPPDNPDGAGGDIFVIEDGKASILSSDPGDPSTLSASSFPLGQQLALQFISSDGATAYMYRGAPNWQGPPCMTHVARTKVDIRILPIRDCVNDTPRGVSQDGSSVFVNSRAELSNSWTAGIYRMRGNLVETLIEIPNGTTANQTPWAGFVDSSRDGSSVLFNTNARLSPDDNDWGGDAYIRHPDGSMSLVSEDTPEFSSSHPSYWKRHQSEVGISLSADGQKALFSSLFALSPADHDRSIDLYLYRRDQAPTLVTTGSADVNQDVRNPPIIGQMGWAVDPSDDFGTIAFVSESRLTPDDQDDSLDVYRWRNGETILISTGPTSQNANLDAELLEVSNDGTKVAFWTRERLTNLDNDSSIDYYVGSDERSRISNASAGHTLKTQLLTAESVSPKVNVPKRAKAISRKALALRLTCPSNEATGPCRVAVNVRQRKRPNSHGAGKFRIAVGKSRTVKVKLNRRVHPTRKWRALVRVGATDRLGNSGDAQRTVVVRSAGKPSAMRR